MSFTGGWGRAARLLGVNHEQCLYLRLMVLRAKDDLITALQAGGSHGYI